MSGQINPYGELIVSNTEEVDTILSQIKEWAILSNLANYIQYDKHPKNFHNLDIKAVNQKNHKRRSNTKEERQMLELDF